MKDESRITDAKELPAEFFEALARWREEALEIWNSDRIEWYSKLVKTTFIYNGRSYVVIPEDVYPENFFAKYPEGSLHAGTEILQKTIEKDLISLGAENIKHYGFLD